MICHSVGKLMACLVACLLLASGFSASAAPDRVALVIGNGAYRHVTPLANPPNDATDLAAASRTLGFDVVEGQNLDRRFMQTKIQEFAGRLDRAKVAVFFYAGHAFQTAGRNYLVPTDAKLERASDIGSQTIELDQALDKMESDQRVNLVFLDACRDNPFPSNSAPSVSFRPGLASMQSPGSTLLTFATEPGQVALDGEGRNSPFTAALVKHIVTPGLVIESVIVRVRADVLQTTSRSQIPWSHSSLTGELVLVPVLTNQAPYR
jgi:uncharacterized caspase-like protein